ncbi:MAG: TrkH family potassium uptake protein [Bacteroidales bacterium]|nr:TrkH family potassium uptake protein [Bacteroidales bacterium]
MRSIHFSVVMHIVGLCLMLESLFLLLTTLIAIVFNDGTMLTFIESAGISFLFGFILFRVCKFDKQKTPTIKDSFLIVTFSWVFISLFGSLPYLLSRSIPNFVDAFFETVSGFTTTGSSILTDIEVLPKAIQFWRAETHWIGGMGIIALVVVILPSLKVTGNQLFSAEGAFFSTEKIHPRLIDAARRLWLVYIILTLSETLLLMFAKMNWFDAVCHSFATVATGGFSTKNTSIIDYSPTIQYIITFFMFLSGMNFVLHFMIFTGRFKKAFRDEELKYYIAIVLIITIILSYNNYSFYKDIETSFRQSIFQIVSIITATGFVSANYEQWSQVSIAIVFFIMFIGACTGSTGGGIKIARYTVVLKSIGAQFKRTLHPNCVSIVKYNKKSISDKVLNNISSFVVIYFLTFVVGTFIMMGMGLNVSSAASSSITTLGGIGPGLGLVGPVNSFASINNGGKLFLCFNMILGRLEIISVLSLFTKSFYKV